MTDYHDSPILFAQSNDIPNYDEVRQILESTVEEELREEPEEPRPPEEAIHDAADFLASIPQYAYSAQAGPGGGGAIAIVWKTPDSLVYIEFSSADRVRYYAKGPSGDQKGTGHYGTLKPELTTFVLNYLIAPTFTEVSASSFLASYTNFEVVGTYQVLASNLQSQVSNGLPYLVAR
jgi:hypothetical protein